MILDDKQNNLLIATDPLAASLMSGSNVVKCLKTTSPLTYTDVDNKVTVALDDAALATVF